MSEELTEQEIDQGIVDALRAIMAAKGGGIVNRGIVAFQTLDPEGEMRWEWRMVGDVSWFDVGGVSQMLAASMNEAYTNRNRD